MLGLAFHCYDYGDDYYNSCFCGLGSFWIEFCSEASFDKIILTFSEKNKTKNYPSTSLGQFLKMVC